MFKGISKETKVGSLTAVAITMLILGYNYMVGKDNPFKVAREFYVFFDSAQGVQESTPVMLNGYKVGQLRKMKLVDESKKIEATIEIFANLNIPKDSKVKIDSKLLGGMSLNLLLGNSKTFAEDEDTLQAAYAQDMMNMLNEKLAPIAARADSLLSNLNALIGRESVKKTFDALPSLVADVNRTINDIGKMVSDLSPSLTGTMNNLSAFSNNLNSYGKSIDKSLKSFEKISSQLDSVQVKSLVTSLESTIKSLSSVVNDIQAGKGTLGKLAKDDSLYKSLNQTMLSLSCLLNDLNRYPEKYLPLPWGKQQRKKAKEKSDLNNCFPLKDSASKLIQ